MFVCLRSKNLLPLFFLIFNKFERIWNKLFYTLRIFVKKKVLLFFIFLFLSKDSLQSLHIKNLIVGSQHEHKTVLMAVAYCKSN